MGETEEMSNTKAWAIISTIAVAVGVIIAGTMFFLGLTVGQNSAKAEASDICEREAV